MPQEDLALIPYTFLPQFDDMEFDIREMPNLLAAGFDGIDKPAELGNVLLRSGKTKTRLVDLTGLTIRQVLSRIVQFYKHKTYRKVFETHGSCFCGFMINTRKGEPPLIMLDRC